MPQTPIPPDVSLPQEPSVPDISGMMASVDQSSGLMESVPEVPVLGMDIPQMPQIPPSDVSQLLGTGEEPPPPTPQIPQIAHPEEHLQIPQTPMHPGTDFDHLQQMQMPDQVQHQIPQISDPMQDMQPMQQMPDMSHLPQMENMGYDGVCICLLCTLVLCPY